MVHFSTEAAMFFSTTAFIWKKHYLFQKSKNNIFQILRLLKIITNCSVKNVTRFIRNSFAFFSFLKNFVLIFILVALSISLIIVLVNSFIFNNLYSQQKLSEQMAGIHTPDFSGNYVNFNHTNQMSQSKRHQIFY